MKKCLVVLICSLCILKIPIYSVFAQESPASNSDLSILFDDSYQKIIDSFFKYPDSYTVYDLVGKDITNQFYSNNMEFYDHNDLNEIKNNIYRNVQSFCECISITEIPFNARMGRTKSVSNRYTDIMRSNETSFSFAYEYLVSGIFVYNTNTGKISSAYGAGFTPITTDPADSWKCEAKDVVTSSSVSSNGYKAQFTANFKVYASAYAYLIPYETYYYGSHTRTLYAEGD